MIRAKDKTIAPRHSAQGNCFVLISFIQKLFGNNAEIITSARVKPSQRY